MNNTLFVKSKGLAFNEQKDMDTLSEYAKKGWILERLQFTGYQLKRDQPQNLIYSLGIEENPSSEYFKLFEESGWTHVYSKDYLHFFKAPEGTTPIYTDKGTVVERFKIEKDKKLQSSKRIIYVLLLLVIISVFTEMGWLPTFVGDVSILAIYICGILLIFTLLPFFSYRKKYKDFIEKISDI